MSTIFIDEVQGANILQRMWQECGTDQFCDVMLIAGAEEIKIPAHRNILSYATEYFKGMFTSLRESREKEVKISSVNGHALKSIIEFLYTGRVEIRNDNVEDLLETADLLLLKNVVTACGEFLAKHLDPANCLGFTLLAERYRCQSLLEQAKEYSLAHFMDVNKTEEFLKLNFEQLDQLITSDKLRVTSEKEVFHSLLLWLEHDRCEREKYKDLLLKLVRLPLLEPMFLHDHVKHVFTSAESRQLYFEVMEWNLLQGRSALNPCISIKPRMCCQYLMGITLSKPDNKMFIHYYCPQRLKWMRWMNNLEYRHNFDVATMGHNIYIAGGRDATDNVLNTVLCLNMKTMTSTPLTAMAERRSSCRAAVLKGFLYVLGGFDGSNDLSSAERWDPKTNTWHKVASLSVGRFWFGIAELNNKLYVVGGNFGGIISSAEYYDSDLNVWTSIASMGKSRQGHAVVVLNGLLYALGGDVLKTAERYDPVTNQWNIICSLRENLVGLHFCTTFNHKIVACCGDRIDEYDAITNEWKTNQSLKGLPNLYCIFSYADELLITEFSEN